MRQQASLNPFREYSPTNPSRASHKNRRYLSTDNDLTFRNPMNAAIQGLGLLGFRVKGSPSFVDAEPSMAWLGPASTIFTQRGRQGRKGLVETLLWRAWDSADKLLCSDFMPLQRPENPHRGTHCSRPWSFPRWVGPTCSGWSDLCEGSRFGPHSLGLGYGV